MKKDKIKSKIITIMILLILIFNVNIFSIAADDDDNNTNEPIQIVAFSSPGEEKMTINWTDSGIYPEKLDHVISLENQAIPSSFWGTSLGSFTTSDNEDITVDLLYTYKNNNLTNKNTTLEIVVDGQVIISQKQSSEKANMEFKDSVNIRLNRGRHVVYLQGSKPTFLSLTPDMENIKGYIKFSNNAEDEVKYTVKQSKDAEEFTTILSGTTKYQLILGSVNGVRDFKEPIEPSATIYPIRGTTDKVKLEIKGADEGTTYNYFITGKKGSKTNESNVAGDTITTGLKGFCYTIDQNSDTILSDDINLNGTGDLELKTAELELPKDYINKGYYIHVKSIDNVGNVSETLHMSLSFEERKIYQYKNYKEAGEKDGVGVTTDAGWNYLDLDWDKLPVKTEYQEPIIMLVIDTSGSMRGSRISNARSAAKAMSTQLFNKIPKLRIGVMGFASYVYTRLSPSTSLSSIHSAINTLGASGDTHTRDAVNSAASALRGYASKNKIIVLVTDGVPCPSSQSPYGAMSSARASGISIVSVLIGLSNSSYAAYSDYYYANVSNSAIYSTFVTNVYDAIIDSITPKYTLYRKKEGERGYTIIQNKMLDVNFRDTTAKDVSGPERPIVSIGKIDGTEKLGLDVKVEDRGTVYEYYVKATYGTSGEILYSNDVIQEIKTGIKGFAWTIDSSSTTDPGSIIRALPETLDIGNVGNYLHLRAIDWAGNLGEVVHIKIENGRLIPQEELDGTKELFCVQHGQTIPARRNANYKNTVVTAGTGQYKFTQSLETVRDGDVIGKRFVEGTTQNIYGTEPIYTYTLGDYKISMDTPTRQPGKEGNASEKDAFLLYHYRANNNLSSDIQKAMYSSDAATGNLSWDWEETPESKALVAEANAYEAYRKAGYDPQNYKKKTNTFMSEDFSQILIGPFKLKYTPKGIKIDGMDRPWLYFANIIGARLYDQKGNLIGEKDRNGRNIGSLQWDFVYLNGKPGAKRTDEMFSYDNYKFPVGDEEFYIRLNYSSILDSVTQISRIEFTHQKLIADAQYDLLEGTYNKVKWEPNVVTRNGNDVLWCNEVDDNRYSTCVHGKTYNHIIGCYFYLTAKILETNRDLEAQKLVDLDWAKMYYENIVQTIVPGQGIDDPNGDDDNDDDQNDGGDSGWKITIDFYGNIWDDGIEDSTDGIKVSEERGVEKVLIRAYRTDIDGNRLGEIYYTYSDANGNYRIKDATRGMYDVEFEYDGQTFKTTKLLVNGTIIDYKSDITQKKFANNSMAEETREERQWLNNNFEEIAGNDSSYGASGQIPLEYESSNGKSTIVTLRDGYVKDEFKLNSRTSTNSVYYPISERRVINGNTFIKIVDAKDVNLGLAERLKTDENLKMDVYESTFVIKQIRQSFIHSERNIRDKNNIKDVPEYIQYVNRADYNWRWQDYYDKFGEPFKEIWNSADESELESYVDYIIAIRNEGEKDFVRISELADYYDKSYEYSDKYRDFDLTSWAVVKSERPTESQTQNNSETIKVDWNNSSKYAGVTNPYSSYYNKMYTNSLEQLTLKKGEYIELHIIFHVLKDENNNIILDEIGEGKKNFAEINGYKTYYLSDGSIAGLIDYNSKPGNLNPLQDISLYEDDEDKAPNYKLQLDTTTVDNNGIDEDTHEANGENGEDDPSKIKKDEQGRIIGYGNVIEGCVWEDLRKDQKEEFLKELENRQIIGDGIRQREEPLIKDIKIELVEIFENIRTGKKFEGIIREQKTRNVLSLSNEAILDGSYKFTQLSSGKYKVQFKYGTEAQLQNNMKYNGQDYQGVNTEDIYKNEELSRSFDNVEIMVCIDTSNSMTGDKIEEVKKSAKELVTKLNEKLTGVKIGLVSFNQDANELVKPMNKIDNTLKTIENLATNGETSIGRGIDRSINSYSSDIEKKIMIVLTDGEETVENNEEVIRKIEKATDDEEIELISVLTKESNQIFGSESSPRRGRVYNIKSNNMQEEIAQNVYEIALEASIVKKDRSYGRDIEGNENAEGTRIYNIKEYQTMGVQKGERLDISSIDNLAMNQKQEAIKEFVEKTWMTAITDKIEFKANNVKRSKIEQINLALRERPIVELTMYNEIEAIKITLSDGEVIIDTEKGISKNVNGLEYEELPISIYLDEEIMHGATITVRYKVNITNTGEIDRMSNYITGASDETIPTLATIVYNYATKNTLYREDEQKDNIWEEIVLTDARNYLNSQTYKGTKNRNMKIYATPQFKANLYPIGSVEASEANDENTYIEKYITLSKIISPQDGEDTLTYESAMEIVERYNEAGRRSYSSIPGNYDIEHNKRIEPDTTVTRKIIITKPLGGINEASKYVLSVAILILTAIAIIILKEKLKIKHK